MSPRGEVPASTRPGHHKAPRPPRPRYGRITALTSSLVVIVVALLGAAGALPGTTGSEVAADTTADTTGAIALSAVVDPVSRQLEHEPAVTWRRPALEQKSLAGQRRAAELPTASGSGRRVVFDISEQRVWLVERGNRVRRTYLVSGGLTDNLQPGTYEVYSTSRHAVGIDDSGTMQFMVRFAHGERAAIGFHDIPVKDGELVQTRAQLGTPRSHGCIRQARRDARALWDFAPVGTKVVVTG